MYKGGKRGMQEFNLQTNNRELIVSDASSKPIYEKTKRCFDFISSLVAIIVFSPVFLAIAVLVKLDSEGPAFFGHKRLGKNGEFIKVYKFRTMKKNAEELLKQLTPEQKSEFAKNFKLENDPRVTKLGDFLRRSSIDELPQLFNILKGDMSVVGPRPIVKEELRLYGRYRDKFLSVKPGLTGNWQANGRSDTTYKERIQLDMDYIDNRSFWFDIMIILQTVVSVLKGRGAR
jgi:lipopolysaccharide/colanic/teichoic acid biosynthesis glycosyltransferase